MSWETIVLGILAVERTVDKVTKFLSEESKARREAKRAKKAHEKAKKRAERARFEQARKDAGLTDEGGGSRAGHEARAEWDREQAKKR